MNLHETCNAATHIIMIESVSKDTAAVGHEQVNRREHDIARARNAVLLPFASVEHARDVRVRPPENTQAFPHTGVRAQHSTACTSRECAFR